MSVGERGSPKKATNEEIVAAYRELGSVWKVARALGMGGQSVWERLRRMGHPMLSAKWTEEEIEELRRLASELLPLGEIASRLGRPYAGVACKVSELGLANRAGNRGPRRIPRGAGYNKVETQKLVRDLRVWDGSLRQFARARGRHLTTLVEAIKRHDPEFWREYSAARGMQAMACPGCGDEFYPMSTKQRCCSVRCTYTVRQDREYFGGKRALTIGLREGVCQLCGKHRASGLHSHHVYGKENDPENEVLVALCPGCHAAIGKLASMKALESTDVWETLVHLVFARKAGPDWKDGRFHGTYVSVEVELLSAGDVEQAEELPG